ncbi:hypothetical protein AB0L74_21505 [Streptomyces sp. NPDC052020]|uniref:hypothetical protein n=1 Tax=Streptomyces sp. NPDC052020 TaxID=3155677 RepID=UPI00342F396C
MKAVVHWLAVPVVQRAESDRPPVLKYEAPEGVVVRDRGTAYVGTIDEEAAQRLLAHPDVEILSAEEKRRVELVPGMPVPWESLERQILSLGTDHWRRGVIGLGDVVSALTRRARIPECGGCARRRKGLNRITVWGWWRNRKLRFQPEG